MDYMYGRKAIYGRTSGKVAVLALSQATLEWQINGGRIDNRVGWKFPRYFINERILINGEDGKLKNYYVKKQI